jgi:undecaprenyl-diphosphatase
MIARLQELVRRRPELIALAGFLLVACVVLMVAKLGSEIGEGEVPAFDAVLVRAARTAVDGSASLRSVMLDFTALGDNTTLIVLTSLIVGFFALGREWATALYLAVSTGVGALATTVLKLMFQRARPDIVEHLVPTSTASFPSGHAMNSAVVFLTLAVILGRTIERRAQRVYLLAAAAALVVAIGVSRVFLGVHWPTDVLAGWTVGAAWAITCAMAMEALRRRQLLVQEHWE